MSRWITGICFFFVVLCAQAQTTKTLQVTVPGSLKTLISDEESGSLTSLTLTGSLHAVDFAFIRDRLTALTTLDLSGCNIVKYSGTEGTNTGTQTVYPAGELPQYAFYNPFLKTSLSTLVTLKLPSSLVSIGHLACCYCWNLAGQISIPSTVKNISDQAFYGCYALTAFSVSSSNTRYSSSNGVLFTKSQDTLLLYPNAKAAAYTIPSTVKRIHPSAFENSWAMTGLNMPPSVTSIGKYAFCNCSGVSGNLSLPENLITLEDGAFQSCSNLTGTVTIPSSLHRLGSYCFFLSNNIQSFSVSSSNLNYASGNGLLYSKKLDTLFICPAGKTGTLTLPSTVRLIGSHAFYNCSKLTGNLQIPKLVDYIGLYSFYGCDKLTSYSVESGNAYFTAERGILYSIGKERLLVCPPSVSGTLVLPESLQYLDPCALGNCSLLSGYLNLPASVKYVGDYAFYGCTSLSGFTVDAANPHFAAEEGLLYSKNKDTLYVCPLSKRGVLTLPEGLVVVGHSSMDGCSGLTQVLFPSTLKVIGDYALEYCTGLQKLEIPVGVDSLGWGVLYSCSGLVELSVAIPKPPVIDYYFLKGIDPLVSTLYVPFQSSPLYSSAPYWKNFTKISEKSFDRISDFSNEKTWRTYRDASGWKAEGLEPGSILEIVSLDGRCLFRERASGRFISLPLPGDGCFLIRSGRQVAKVVQ